MSAPVKPPRRVYDPAAKTAASIEAARLLRENLAAAMGDDPHIADLTRDMIEGETSLHEDIATLIKTSGEMDASIDALKAYENTLATRRERFTKARETIRTLIAQAVEMAGVDTLETAYGVVSLKALGQKLVVTDESVIPLEFWKRPDPVLDRKALTDAVKALADDAEPLPGVTLSNGGTTIQIRR